jgi:hypothetical protein
MSIKIKMATTPVKMDENGTETGRGNNVLNWRARSWKMKDVP